MFTFVIHLQVLDQIIEDRKRRVLLTVMLLVLLQLPCSIFLLQSSILEECCSVELTSVLSWWGFSGFCLCILVGLLYTWEHYISSTGNESSNGHCRILAKLNHSFRCVRAHPWNVLDYSDHDEASCVWRPDQIARCELFLKCVCPSHGHYFSISLKSRV